MPIRHRALVQNVYRCKCHSRSLNFLEEKEMLCIWLIH